VSSERRIAYAVTPDGFHIAYAVFGQGELFHVFLPALTSMVDEVQVQHPGHVRFERFVGSLSRFVWVDPRGIGTSDTVPLERIFRLEDWSTDMLAVLDDLEVEQAVITGEGPSGHAAIKFAVSHPERTLRLALMNSYARLARAEDYTIDTYSMGQIDDVAAMFERDWGTGRLTAQFSPNLVTDPSFLAYAACRERRTMPPRTAATFVRRMGSSDVRELLPRVSVPTLVYYTGDLVPYSLDHSRYLAEHIPGAIFVEAPGRSFYLPDETERLNAWAGFVVGGSAALSAEIKVVTLLFTDVVASTELASAIGDDRWAQILADLDMFVTRAVERHGGRIVKQTGDGHLAAFDGPRGALHAASEIVRGVHVLGVEMRCGVHVGEVELRPGGDVGGISVHIAARVRDAAAPRQVVVSRTVADLVAGAGFRFEHREPCQLKGVPGIWQLYEVVSSN
jgi:class 3 adenylate cyclase/pimeloyl-ACP methyl ester carboxylesterase